MAGWLHGGQPPDATPLDTCASTVRAEPQLITDQHRPADLKMSLCVAPQSVLWVCSKATTLTVRRLAPLQVASSTARCYWNDPCSRLRTSDFTSSRYIRTRRSGVDEIAYTMLTRVDYLRCLLTLVRVVLLPSLASLACSSILMALHFEGYTVRQETRSLLRISAGLPACLTRSFPMVASYYRCTFVHASATAVLHRLPKSCDW